MSVALRLVALVWFAVVGLMFGAVYGFMWMIYGYGAVAGTLSGTGMFSYIGVAVVFTPAVLILLASLWLDWRNRHG